MLSSFLSCPTLFLLKHTLECSKQHIIVEDVIDGEIKQTIIKMLQGCHKGICIDVKRSMD